MVAASVSISMREGAAFAPGEAGAGRGPACGPALWTGDNEESAMRLARARERLSIARRAFEAALNDVSSNAG